MGLPESINMEYPSSNSGCNGGVCNNSNGSGVTSNSNANNMNGLNISQATVQRPQRDPSSFIPRGRSDSVVKTPKSSNTRTKDVREDKLTTKKLINALEMIQETNGVNLIQMIEEIMNKRKGSGSQQDHIERT
jgi:hypothetical protein